jgi:hypothetical protein
MLGSAVWAAAIAAAMFAVQMLIWCMVPPISIVSAVYACAPHHAIRLSVWLFAMVFGGMFLIRVPEYVVRPMLCGEDQLPRSGKK